MHNMSTIIRPHTCNNLSSGKCVFTDSFSDDLFVAVDSSLMTSPFVFPH